MCIKYIKQLDSYSCGPTALINLLKWSGHHCIRKEYLKQFKRLMDCTPPDGCYISKFDNVLRKYTDNVECKIQPSITLLDEHLENSGALVVYQSYINTKGNRVGHFFLVIGKTNKTFKLVNPSGGPATKRVTRRVFRRDYINRYTDKDVRYPYVWFIKKEDI